MDFIGKKLFKGKHFGKSRKNKCKEGKPAATMWCGLPSLTPNTQERGALVLK